MENNNTTLSTKRKRAQISYAQPEESFLEDEVAPAYDSVKDELPDGDTAYGARKRTPKGKSRSGKRARLTLRRLSRPKKPFRFLDLPPELRDYIYDLTLTQAGGVGVVARMKGFRRLASRGHFDSAELDIHDDKGNEIQQRFVPSLLGVCKQIHSEASGYLYKQRIVVETTMTLHTFLAGIGPTNQQLLSEIVVNHWAEGRGTHKAMNVAGLTSLATCTNLHRLYLDCVIGYTRTPKQLARQIYRDGHYFLEAFGRAQGKKDGAIDILELNPRNFESCYWDGPGRRYTRASDPEKFKSQFEDNLRALLLS